MRLSQTDITITMTLLQDPYSNEHRRGTHLRKILVLKNIKWKKQDLVASPMKITTRLTWMSLRALKWLLRFQQKRSPETHTVHLKVGDILNLETNLCRGKAKGKTDMKTIDQTYRPSKEKALQRKGCINKVLTLLKTIGLTPCQQALKKSLQSHLSRPQKVLLQ